VSLLRVATDKEYHFINISCLFHHFPQVGAYLFYPVRHKHAGYDLYVALGGMPATPPAIGSGLFERRRIVFRYRHSLDSPPNVLEMKSFIRYLLDFSTAFIFAFMALAIALFWTFFLIGYN